MATQPKNPDPPEEASYFVLTDSHRVSAAKLENLGLDPEELGGKSGLYSNATPNVQGGVVFEAGDELPEELAEEVYPHIHHKIDTFGADGHPTDQETERYTPNDD